MTPTSPPRELLNVFWESVLELGRIPRDEEFDRFGEPTFAAARQRRKEDLLVFIAAAQLRRKIPFNQLSLRLQAKLAGRAGSALPIP